MIAFFILAQPIVSTFVEFGPDRSDFESRLADHTLNLLLNGILQPNGSERHP
jgi:hypothetical protein